MREGAPSESALPSGLEPQRDAPNSGNCRQPAAIRGTRSSGQRLLAAIGPGLISAQIVQRTSRLAENLNCPWVVLYVETSSALSETEQSRLAHSLALARELGAEVVTTTSTDVVDGILRIAEQRKVTGVIVAKPHQASWWQKLGFEYQLLRLLRESSNLEVHAIPAEVPGEASSPLLLRKLPRPLLFQYLVAIAVVAAVTLAAFAFTPVIGAHATALVFLLTVVFLALVVERGPTLVAAAASAVCWDYFFLPPVFAFRITNVEDAMLFGMYFVVALTLSQLTARIRAQEAAERGREARATALYLLTRALNEAATLDEIAQKIVQQIESAFDCKAALLFSDSGNGLTLHPASSFTLAQEDRTVASRLLQDRQQPWSFRHNLNDTRTLYLPLPTGSGLPAIIAFRWRQTQPPTSQQKNLLEAFSQQIALALDRQRLRDVSERAKLLAESERLSKTLLDSMSHEIRTPIAAIKGATDNLADALEYPLLPAQREMLLEIQEATERLNRVVGNVLEAGRLESGALKPRFCQCDVADLVHVVLVQTEKELKRHKVSLQLAPQLPLVSLDFVLMQQALANLVSNAAVHTPPGTIIEVSARVQVNSLLLSVSDQGPGIPPDSLQRVFDKFYRGANAPTGGMGLGLSLVKGFVEVQGGIVTVENKPQGGAVFAIVLPLSKSPAGAS
jgi:two-component system sensor histidine kinase KdpD